MCTFTFTQLTPLFFSEVQQLAYGLYALQSVLLGGRTPWTGAI